MYIKMQINVEKPVATRQLVFIFMTALSSNLFSRTTSLLTGYFHSCNTDLKREHSGSVVDCLTLDWGQGNGLETHRHHCVVSLSKAHLSLTRPDIRPPVTAITAKLCHISNVT